MIPTCLIASYGGSGSTFLAKALKSIASSHYAFDHVHSVPANNFLGIPIFNRLTQHSEGPFSKEVELPKSSKVILIYRDPAEAYLSRCSFKHFLHIWSETDRIEQVFGDEDITKEAFNRAWRIHEREGRDILDLKRFIALWRDYAQRHRHDICFVRYEQLAEAWPQLLDFLKISEKDASAIQGFAPSSRMVPSDVAQMFSAFRAEMASWPPIEIFNQADADGPVPTALGPVQPLRLENTVFSANSLGAGASDALARFSLVQDIVKTWFDTDVRLPPYRNYHSPEIDFFELFGVNDLVMARSDDDPPREQVPLTVRQLIFHLLYDSSFFRDDVEYLIQPDLYPNAAEVQKLAWWRGIDRAFLDKIRYTPKNRIFNETFDSVKVVAHLRRQDICGEVLFAGLNTGEVPESVMGSIQSRPLLTVADSVHALEARYPKGTKVQLVIASDGVARVRQQLGRFPVMKERLDTIEAELCSSPESSDIVIELVDRIIGTGPDETIRTLDAMYTADLVLTASSSFPNLVCRAGKTELQIVRFE